MSSRKIGDLDPRIQDKVKQLLSEYNSKGYVWRAFITDGFRSNAEQAELYARGRTKPGRIVTYARPGQSNHNKGLAVDIAFQRNGKLSYAKIHYDRIVPIAKRLGFTWGGDWRMRDTPHFEITKFDNKTPPQKKAPMEINDQTLIDLGKPWNKMEVQAIRSSLNDLKRDNESLKKGVEDSANLYKTAQKRIEELEEKYKKLLDKPIVGMTEEQILAIGDVVKKAIDIHSEKTNKKIDVVQKSLDTISNTLDNDREDIGTIRVDQRAILEEQREFKSVLASQTQKITDKVSDAVEKGIINIAGKIEKAVRSALTVFTNGGVKIRRKTILEILKSWIKTWKNLDG